MGEVTAKRLKFSDLKFLEDNPRTITADDLQRLAGRIKDDPTFFDNRPCLVNFTGGKYLCYAGFQRSHAAAKILKWKDVPCMVENDVPNEVMRKRAILDNTHDGKWDADVLSSWEFQVEEFREMGVPEWVFGVGGEDEGDNSLNSEKVEAHEDDYEIPDEIKTDIVPGDLFEIGRHRLLCGDSTSADDVERLMGGEKAVLCHADPPYGMGKESDGVMNDNLYGTKLDAFQLLWWSAFRPHLTDNASVYIWGNAEDLWRFWFASELSKQEKMYIRNEIVWDKKASPA